MDQESGPRPTRDAPAARIPLTVTKYGPSAKSYFGTAVPFFSLDSRGLYMLKNWPVSLFPRRTAVATAAQKSKSKRSKSGLKRKRQDEKRHERNKSVKSMLKTVAKKVEQAVEAKSADSAKDALVKAMRAFDKAASAGVIHKATASRKLSRLSTKVGKISAA